MALHGNRPSDELPIQSASDLARDLLRALEGESSIQDAGSSIQTQLDAMLLRYTDRGYDLSELRTMLRSGFVGTGMKQTVSNAQAFLDRRLPAVAKAQALGLTPQQANAALAGSNPLDSSSAQYSRVRQRVLGERGMPMVGREGRMLSELEWMQSPASRRAQVRTRKPVTGGEPDPGYVIRDKAAQQFELERTLGATVWPTEGGELQTGLEDPSKLPKRFQQVVSPYEQVFLSGKPIVEAPWRTGSTSDVPERGQILRTALLFGGALPEGMSAIEQSLGEAQNLTRRRVKVPTGFTPELTETGTTWGRGETAALFKGHTGIDTGDWEQHELLSRTYTPGKEGEEGYVEALLQRGVPTTRGVGASFDFAKDLALGMDVEKLLGEPGFEAVKSGGVRDVYGAAYSAMSAMTPAEFKEVTGMEEMPATWQESATALTDVFSGKVAPAKARHFDMPMTLSTENLAQFQEAGRIVGEPEGIGEGRHQATARFPGLDIPMSWRFTRAGTQEHRRPMIAEHTLKRIQQDDPALFAQIMEENKSSRAGQSRRAVAQSYLASRGHAEAPRHTPAADIAWEPIMAQALGTAMEATGAESPETVPMGALQSSLLGAVPKEAGALGFESRGKEYFFPNPSDLPAVRGGMGWEERSAFRWQMSSLIQAQAGRGIEGGEQTFRSQLAKTVLAQHRLATSPEFFRKMRGAEPTSLTGGMAAASWANKPGEVYLSTRKAADAMGIRPGTKEYDLFKEEFEAGERTIPSMNIFREPVTSAQGVQIQARGKWIGAHPEEALRGSEVPIVSPQIGQALYGDFDKDDYLIAANFGVDLQTAQQMKEADASIVQAAETGVAGQAKKQLEEIAKFKDVPAMLDWLQNTRASVPLEQVEQQFAERRQVGRQMGVGFNIQQRLLAAAPSAQARAVADEIGQRMYMSAQDYERWEGPMKRFAQLGVASTKTGGLYDVIEGKPGRVAFGTSGMMAEAARMVGEFDFLSPEQKALAMTPAGETGLLQEVTEAYKKGDVPGVVSSLTSSMTGRTAEWGERTMMGQFIVGQASERAERKGGKAMTPELSRIGQGLRAFSAMGKGAARSLIGKARAAGEWAGVAGPSPTGVEEIFRERPQAGVPLAGPTPGGPAPPSSLSEFDTRLNEWRAEGSAAPFEDWLGQEYGKSPYELEGAAPVQAGGGGRRPPSGAPPAAPPGPAVPPPPPEPPGGERAGQVQATRDESGRVTIKWPSVGYGEFQRSLKLMNERLGEWSDATSKATDGTREYTKWEEQRTKELVKARNIIERASREDTGFAEEDVARAGALMGTGAWGRLSQAEQRLEDIKWTPPGGEGAGGPAGPAGFQAIKRLMIGWTPMQMKRAMGMFTDPQAIGMAAQAEMPGWALTQAIGGAEAELPGGVAGGVMQYQAARRQAQIQGGRAQYRAWGAGTGLMDPLRTAQGIAGAPLGAGLATAIGLSTLGGMGMFGTTAAALAGPVGLGVAGIGAAIGGMGYLSSFGTETAENQLAASEGPWGQVRSTLGYTISSAGEPRALPSLGIGPGYGARQADIGQQLRGTQLDQLDAGQRMAVLNYAAQGLEGGVWEGMDEGQRLQALTPYASQLGTMTGDEISGGGIPEWIEKAIGAGMDTRQFAQTTQQWGMAPEQWSQVAQQVVGASRPAESEQAEFLAGQWRGLLTGGGMSGTDVRGRAYGGGGGWTRGPDGRLQQVERPGLEQMTSEQVMQGDVLGNLMRQMRFAGLDVAAPTTIGGMEEMWQQQPLMQAQLGLTQQFTGMGAGMEGAAAAVQGLGDMGGVLGMKRFMAGDQWEVSRAAGDQGRMDLYLDALSEMIPPDAMADIASMANKLAPIIDTSTGLRVGIVSNAATREMGEAAYNAAAETGRIDPSAATLNYAMMGSRERQAEQTRLQRGYQDFQMGQRERGLGWSQVSQFGGEFEGFETRGSFAIQKELRNLGRIWEDFTQEYQQQQRAVQYSQFMENWQVRAERMPTQFGWQREDLAFRGAQASLQYGWGQEDVQEKLRYATGRERRQLLRQQERQTISYAMQMGQMETQGERIDIREQWAQEDLERQKRHFLERFALQDEYQSRYRAYVERRRELEDELQAIREFGAHLNIEMQTEALERQEQLEEQLRSIQDAHVAVNQHMEDNIALVTLFNETIKAGLADMLSGAVSIQSIASSIASSYDSVVHYGDR